jgi:hypothetical protein
MRNQRHRSSFSIPWLTAALLICGALLMAALSVVVNKNRVTSLAEQQRQIEQEMKMLDMEITGLERKIAQLLDSQRVQPLLQAKGTLLQPILPTANAIIQLRRSEPDQAPDASSL